MTPQRSWLHGNRNRISMASRKTEIFYTLGRPAERAAGHPDCRPAQPPPPGKGKRPPVPMMLRHRWVPISGLLPLKDNGPRSSSSGGLQPITLCTALGIKCSEQIKGCSSHLRLYKRSLDLNQQSNPYVSQILSHQVSSRFCLHIVMDY